MKSTICCVPPNHIRTHIFRSIFDNFHALSKKKKKKNSSKFIFYFIKIFI